MYSLVLQFNLFGLFLCPQRPGKWISTGRHIRGGWTTSWSHHCFDHPSPFANPLGFIASITCTFFAPSHMYPGRHLPGLKVSKVEKMLHWDIPGFLLPHCCYNPNVLKFVITVTVTILRPRPFWHLHTHEPGLRVYAGSVPLSLFKGIKWYKVFANGDHL